MPRWKTGLLGKEGTSQRMWSQESKVTWASRGNKESGCGGGEDSFGICHVWDERAEAAPGSDAALGSPCLPHTQTQRQVLTALSRSADGGLNHLCPMAFCLRHPSFLMPVSIARFIKLSRSGTGTLKSCLGKVSGNRGTTFPSLCLRRMPSSKWGSTYSEAKLLGELCVFHSSAVW